MIKLNVSATNIAVEEKETLTEGRVGLLCQFRFTDEWVGLAKTAVFDGADSRDVILKNDTVAIPAECLSAEGYSLSVGVYGKNAAGDIVIPTVYATVGKIQRSAYPSGREPAAPTPDVVAQIQQAAANAEELARSVREDADLGKFNGAKGEKGDKGDKGNTGPAGEAGGFYTPAVTQPDANTMRVAFSPSKEGMPAVADTDITLPAGGGSGGSSIAIDETLTEHGKAADAKAVGDAIRSLSEEMLAEESDPTVPAWAKQPQKPTYTADEVGADESGSAEAKVSAHNTGADSHSDIRLLIHDLTERLNALADSDDTTLDQLSEVVAYIKANRDLISSITTSKVNVTDIINNLTTNVSNKPLSAAQGVALKALIDAITVPTKVSQLENDKGYLTEHQDISGKANVADLTAHTGNSTVHVTVEERLKWNKAITDLSTLTLGIHTDGLLYLFVDGAPTGTGIEMSSGSDVVGYVDENNNIVLSGSLAEGTYTVKYEMEDGTVLDIGELSTVKETEMVNQIPLSIESDGSAYNGGLGYKTGYRISSSGAESAKAGCSCTGFIPVKTGDKLYMRGLYLNDDSGNTRLSFYDANKTFLKHVYPTTGGYVSEGNSIYSHTIETANVAFARFSISAIMDGTEIVTVNQPIA